MHVAWRADVSDQYMANTALPRDEWGQSNRRGDWVPTASELAIETTH